MACLSSTFLSFHSNLHIHSSKYSHHTISFSLQPRISLPQITACKPQQNPQTSHFFSTHKKISKFLAQNGVKLLVGSLLFLGSFSVKPVLALTTQKGVTLEEIRGAHNESFEDEEMYVKLLEKEPRNVEALKVVVNGKMRKGKTKDAAKFVERLIDIEPDQVEWRLLRALCYEMMGHLSKAKKFFKEILDERPLMLRALHGLAMVMHKNREGDAVFDMLHEALELAYCEKRVTEERNIKILIAQMHLVKGDLDEALKKYQELINENPQDFRPYLCQGIIYSLQDKKKEAEEQFQIYQNLVPEEFPQRGFLEDVVFAAKTESREQLEKEFKAEFSYKR